MEHRIELTQPDPVVHIKAYSGLVIQGTDQLEVSCEIQSPDLATLLLEEDGQVFLTANDRCKVVLPEKSALRIELAMGSVTIRNVSTVVEMQKVMGNLVMSGVGGLTIDRVGGNLSVGDCAGSVKAEKVGGSFFAQAVQGDVRCEKVGGNTRVKAMGGHFYLGKTGGSFRGQNFEKSTTILKVGGSCSAGNLNLTDDLKVGGSLNLKQVTFTQSLSLRAGGDIQLSLTAEPNIQFDLKSGAETIRIQLGEEDQRVHAGSLSYEVGDGSIEVSASAGGDILIEDSTEAVEDIVGDLSDRFVHEETALSDMIQAQVESALRQTGAKLKTAELRLEKMKGHVEKMRGSEATADPDDLDEMVSRFEGATPPASGSQGRKGASDEERLMILKMLQEKKINVDEAETLFKALEQ